MKINELYTPPQIEVSEVLVEAGFSFSAGAGIVDTEDGDPWGPAEE